jgi:uncharacterized protein (UPF0303 family)
MSETIEQERQRIEAEEKALVFETFTNDDAIALGLALLEKGRARGLPIAVDVERAGHRLFHAALPGASPDNFSWIERKKRLVNRVQKSSYAVGLKLRASGKSLAESMYLDEKEYAPHGGCVPVVVARVGFVGTVTVSGLPQQEDHALAVEAMREAIEARAAQAAR